MAGIVPGGFDDPAAAFLPSAPESTSMESTDQTTTTSTDEWLVESAYIGIGAGNAAGELVFSAEFDQRYPKLNDLPGVVIELGASSSLGSVSGDALLSAHSDDPAVQLASFWFEDGGSTDQRFGRPPGDIEYGTAIASVPSPGALALGLVGLLGLLAIRLRAGSLL